MRGVSEVIAIILILMITISLAGLAYMFMSTTMSDVTASAGSTVDTTTSSMLTSFKIESIDIAKVYVRNTGQNPLTSLSVYINDEPAVYNVTTPIAAGAVGTITIYSFIPDGATIKVTSPSGFSASKVANPCERAAACWKFDEGSGNYTHDSSPNGNIGTLVNGPVWTSGRYGNAIQFDGSNDYVSIADSSSLRSFSSGFSITVWTRNYNISRVPLSRWGPNNGYGFYSDDRWYMGNGTWVYISSGNKADGNWHFFALVWNGTYINSYVDSVLNSSTFFSNPSFNSPSNNLLTIAADNRGPSGFFNGTIDEVRIYDRAIY